MKSPPLFWREVGGLPVPLEVGRAQADVLMLHHLVPDELAPGSLEPNLAFYEPRTAHGSSLSPGILRAAAENEADLIALGWAQNLDEGRATVVR